MNNDLISRAELKKAVNQLYDETLDGIVKFGIEKAYELIDKAPAVNLVSPTINVNIPEETKQKLIEELQKPHLPIILPEPEVDIYTKDDMAREYLKGYYACKHMSKRPQGVWIIEYDYLKCPFCGMSIDDEVHWLYSEEYSFNFCPNCGAKLKGGVE